MLRIVVGDETFDEETNTFDLSNEIVLDLEHSLVSLSKWESKYQKPFLAPGLKTTEELFGYMEAMVVTPNIDPDVLYRFTQKDLESVQEYIDSSQSATTFGVMPEQRRGQGEIITSELIYYWMVAFNINFECQHWHLNRLFSLIRVCNIKNAKPKRMTRNEVAMRNREINEQRRKQLNTTG